MSDEKQILYDSDEAARPIKMIFRRPDGTETKELDGWEAGGYWYENEHLARYAGSTHKRCEKCGTIGSRSGICSACWAADDEEKWQALPQEPLEWPLCSDGDRYIWDDSGLSDYYADLLLDNPETLPEDLRLTLCSRGGAAILDLDDLYGSVSDGLPEGFDSDDWDAAVVEAFEALAKAVVDHWPEVWFPRSARPRLDDLKQALAE